MLQYGFCFWFYRWMAHCFPTSVTFIVLLVLISFSKVVVIWLFYKWLVSFVVLSKFCIVKLNFGSQCMSSSSFLSSHSVKSMLRVCLFLLFSGSSVIFPRKFISFFLRISWYFPFIGKIFLHFNYVIVLWFYWNRWRGIDNQFFFCSEFFGILICFLRLVTCFFSVVLSMS